MLNAALLSRLAGQKEPDTGLFPDASGAAFHSGRVRPGDVFFALPGAAAHGLQHAHAALAAGAAFIVSDEPHPQALQVNDPAGLLLALGRHARAQLKGEVIAISGSSGKTTTKGMLAALLAAPATPGNYNTPLALACTLVHAWLHTPDQPLILELGIDHPGEMQQLLDLTRPTCALLTSIGASHLEQLGSVSNVASEKRQLLDAVAATGRFASLQAAAALDSRPAGLVTWGLDGSADESAVVSREDFDSQTITWRGEDFDLGRPGRAMAANLTGALAVARHFGVTASLARQRLSSLTLEEGRLQFRRIADRLVLDDTYNSNPASVREALEVLTRSPAPHSAILGDMRELGDLTASAHYELGRATLGLERVIHVGQFGASMQEGNPAVLTAAGLPELLPLLDSLPAGGTLLLKASRSLGFERLIDELQRLEQEASCR
jgi:UDP-N-acetylmuramoyl-tripeptide--D-alanyl-D-alanine ligase